MTTRLFVGNLPYSADKAIVTSEFTALGLTVTNVHIPNDRETGRPRGFAFVEVSDDAAKALAVTEGLFIDRRPIRVETAAPRPARPSGGGNGNGGGGGGGDRRGGGGGGGGGNDRGGGGGSGGGRGRRDRERGDRRGHDDW